MSFLLSSVFVHTGSLNETLYAMSSSLLNFLHAGFCDVFFGEVSAHLDLFWQETMGHPHSQMLNLEEPLSAEAGI